MATTSELDIRDRLEADPYLWKATLFEAYMRTADGAIIPDAAYHRAMWQWAWQIRPGSRPRPFVAIWPRGGAKSTNAEQITIALGARRIRRYAWYISGTQDQADDHVGTIASMLESPRVAAFYPQLATRKVGKYGSSRGWRRNRLRTAAGFTVDALGLDTAARGIKLEEHRPDLIVLDDIDDTLDGPATIRRKLAALTRKILPAGATSVAVLAVQNLVHPDSIFSQLAAGDTDFLTDRILSGPIPAIEGFAYSTGDDGQIRILAGTPTWPGGLPLARCAEIIADIGITAFLAEHQHEVKAPPGGIFSHLDFAPITVGWDQLPDLVRIVVWVDPAVTDTDQSDSHAIQADGIAPDGTIYRLYSWEQRATPVDAITRALVKAGELRAEAVGIETDQGGDTWQSVFREAKQTIAAGDLPDDLKQIIARIPMRNAKAGAGHGPKTHRAQLMLADYERNRIRHVAGTHRTLEAALHRFPLTKPLDLVDAAYWSWHDLRNAGEIAGSSHEGGREHPDEERAIRDAYTAQRRSNVWS